MDIFQAFSPTERAIEILHPVDGSPLGIKVTVMSFNDERMKRVKRKIQDDGARLSARGKSFKAEEVEENRIILTHAAMTGWEWSGDVNFKGSKPDFNLKNVREVLNAMPFMHQQIEEAVSDEAAFFQI